MATNYSKWDTFTDSDPDTDTEEPAPPPAPAEGPGLAGDILSGMRRAEQIHSSAADRGRATDRDVRQALEEAIKYRPDAPEVLAAARAAAQTAAADVLERPALRFAEGARVEVRVTSGGSRPAPPGGLGWRPGTVAERWFDAGDALAPYRVLLDAGGDVTVRQDDDRCVRAAGAAPKDFASALATGVEGPDAFYAGAVVVAAAAGRSCDVGSVLEEGRVPPRVRLAPGSPLLAKAHRRVVVAADGTLDVFATALFAALRAPEDLKGGFLTSEGAHGARHRDRVAAAGKVLDHAKKVHAREDLAGTRALDGAGPLRRAAEFPGEAEAVALIRRLAPLKPRADDVSRALKAAALKNRVGATAALSGCRCDGRIDAAPALHAAADRGHAKVCQALLDVCPADAPTEKGVTALAFALARDRPGACAVLLRGGADPLRGRARLSKVARPVACAAAFKAYVDYFLECAREGRGPAESRRGQRAEVAAARDRLSRDGATAAKQFMTYLASALATLDLLNETKLLEATAKKNETKLLEATTKKNETKLLEATTKKKRPRRKKKPSKPTCGLNEAKPLERRASSSSDGTSDSAALDAPATPALAEPAPEPPPPPEMPSLPTRLCCGSPPEPAKAAPEPDEPPPPYTARPAAAPTPEPAPPAAPTPEPAPVAAPTPEPAAAPPPEPSGKTEHSTAPEPPIEPNADGAVVKLLAGLGLSRLLPTFRAHEIDDASLPYLTCDDFEGMGIPTGPRRRILCALQPKKPVAQPLLTPAPEPSKQPPKPAPWNAALAGPPSPPRGASAAARPSFNCPISMEVFRDPVVAADGHTYERSFIAAWLERQDSSPVTGEGLAHKMLTPNHAMRSDIAEWADACRRAGTPPSPEKPSKSRRRGRRKNAMF